MTRVFPRITLLRAAGLLAVMLAAAGLAQALKPTRQIADRLPAIDLNAQVPAQFSGWHVDPSVAPVVPDPTLQARLDSVYDQTLARSYVNAQGERVMLTIAYGRNQSSEATAVHRPEFCYGAQGFSVQRTGTERVAFTGGAVKVQRLVGELGRRVEPISYWVTLADQATLPGVSRKWAQLRMGLAGEMADGMLVRVSTLAKPGTAADELSYVAQDRFLSDFAQSLPPSLRQRYFGA
ncbi:MAG: exosortase-associated protein EpsI, B-type [Rhizobacter sp.]